MDKDKEKFSFVDWNSYKNGMDYNLEKLLQCEMSDTNKVNLPTDIHNHKNIAKVNIHLTQHISDNLTQAITGGVILMYSQRMNHQDFFFCKISLKIFCKIQTTGARSLKSELKINWNHFEESWCSELGNRCSE